MQTIGRRAVLDVDPLRRMRDTIVTTSLGPRHGDDGAVMTPFTGARRPVWGAVDGHDISAGAQGTSQPGLAWRSYVVVGAGAITLAAGSMIVAGLALVGPAEQLDQLERRRSRNPA